MSWELIIPPHVEADVAQAADWYRAQQPGLEDRFLKEVLQVLASLKTNPLLNSPRHSSKNIRWRSTEHFPYLVVYEVDEEKRLVSIAAVLHFSRHNRHWRKRVR